MGKVKDYLHEWLEETGFEFSIDAGPDPAGLITFSALKKKNKKIVGKATREFNRQLKKNFEK